MAQNTVRAKRFVEASQGGINLNTA